MRSSLRRVLLAATLVAAIVVPAIGTRAAGPEDRLQETRQQLENLRSQIAEGDDRADLLKSRIDVLNRQMTILQIEINRLSARVARIESQVRTAQAGIDRTAAEIGVVRDRATRQAVALYKTGGVDTIDALLTSRSLSELNDRIEFLGVAAQRNTGALVRYHRLKLQIELQYDVLFARKRDLSATLTDRSSLAAKLQQSRSRLLADLAELRTKLAQRREREGDLESVALRLTGDIRSAQARDAVAALGESAQGFIWPLNGSVTSPYGYRWGRMHTGIDIDGYSGQPVVAAKQGRVVLASYYGGYGNAVAIDHGGGVSTLYAHLSSFGVSTGEYVEQGKIIGEVGCTGSCTGDHLHFEVRINGRPDDPMKYLP